MNEGKGGKMVVEAKKDVRRIGLISRIHASVFEKSIQSVRGGRFGWLVEAIDNANDATATRISMTVDRKGGRIILQDNGFGFGDTQCQRFVSLYDSEESADRKGKNGTGAKAALLHCNRISVVSVSAETPETVTSFSFTKDEFARALQGAYTIYASYETRNGKNFSPELTTGSIITYSEFYDEKLMPGADAIQQHLGRFLAPWVAEKVRVNGKPLAARAIEGECLEKEINHEALGLVRVKLFVPKKKHPDEDFMIGAFGPVCTFRELLREMDPAIASLIPEVFLYPDLCGLIDVSGFNTFSTPNRRTFSPTLFDHDLLYLFVTAILDTELAEELQRRVGIIAKTESDETIERALGEVQAWINRVYDHTPGAVPGEGAGGSEKRKHRFEISPPEVEVLIHETETFSIRHYDGEPHDLIWTLSRGAGTLDVEQGTEVQFTAGGNEGRFQLSVSHRSNPDVKDTATIIVRRTMAFCTRPPRLTLVRGVTHRFAVKNTQGSSGQFRWIPDHCGGSITSSEGLAIHYTAGQATGVYRLRVEDRKDRSRFYEVPINIIAERGTSPPPADGGLKGPRGIHREIRIRDRVFSLQYQYWPRSTLTSDHAHQVSYTILYVNVGHPCYLSARGAGDPAVVRYLLMEAAAKYAYLAKADDAESTDRLRADVLAELFL